MKKTIFILSIVVLIPSILARVNSSSDKKIYRIIKKEYPNFTQISSINIKLSDYIEEKSPFTQESVILKKIRSSDLTVYALNGEVWGKTTKIEFLIFFNNKGLIKKIYIIKAPGAYGFKLKNRKWLKKFTNFNNPAEIVLGKTVDSITGATLSASVFTDGMKKSMKIFKKLIKSSK